MHGMDFEARAFWTQEEHHVCHCLFGCYCCYQDRSVVHGFYSSLLFRCTKPQKKIKQDMCFLCFVSSLFQIKLATRSELLLRLDAFNSCVAHRTSHGSDHERENHWLLLLFDVFSSLSFHVEMSGSIFSTSGVCIPSVSFLWKFPDFVFFT